MSKPDIFYETTKTYTTKSGEKRQCICKTRYKPSDNPRGRPRNSLTLDEIEKYRDCLKRNGGNIKKSAEELGIKYCQLYRLR